MTSLDEVGDRSIPLVVAIDFIFEDLELVAKTEAEVKYLSTFLKTFRPL